MQHSNDTEFDCIKDDHCSDNSDYSDDEEPSDTRTTTSAHKDRATSRSANKNARCQLVSNSFQEFDEELVLKTINCALNITAIESWQQENVQVWIQTPHI